MTTRPERKISFCAKLSAATGYHLAHYFIGCIILIGFVFEFFVDWNKTHFILGWHLPHARLDSAINFIGLFAMTFWLLNQPKRNFYSNKFVRNLPLLWTILFSAATFVPIPHDPYTHDFLQNSPRVMFNIFIMILGVIGYAINYWEDNLVYYLRNYIAIDKILSEESE